MKHSRLFAIISILLSTLIIVSIPLISPIKPFLPHLNYLLGVEKPTSYLVLLGNDTEIRANGGFVGSYAKLVMNYPNIDLSFQDIYVPNGQLEGYVTPPAPIQEAFQHGTWELANADWEPDFEVSANSIRWFMKKGNEIDPDNLILLNLTSIKKVLDTVGSFSVPEFNAEITPVNLYLFLQGKAEFNFFPGSTQKKDALTAVGSSFFKKILSLPINKKIEISKIIYKDLVDQNIVVSSKNEAFQNLLIKKNFAGKLTPGGSDTYLLVEANLGANKANAYVKRHTEHKISFQNNQTIHEVTVKFQNSSPESNPNPPYHYGGDYKAYLRFYIPLTAQNIKVDREVSTPEGVTPAKQKPVATSQKYDLIELGFWQITPAQNETSVILSYTLPISSDNYSLTILKQHGLITSPQTINLNGKTLTTSLETDFLVP